MGLGVGLWVLFGDGLKIEEGVWALVGVWAARLGEVRPRDGPGWESGWEAKGLGWVGS